ncbi:MAG: hypothetical protein HZA78_07265 [Candidatus Schekmanbacteria bacterium]|nr:hypothetical protein [Candidatus Schekmanbacteria bacterium]
MRFNISGKTQKSIIISMSSLVILAAFWWILRTWFSPALTAFGMNLLYNLMSILFKGVDFLSVYQRQHNLWNDWFMGGLLLGWLAPSLIYVLVSIWGYKSLAEKSAKSKPDAPINLAPVQTHIGKTYWRARLLELEKTSFSILAVGASLFLLLLFGREYLITRLPFIDGATLLCFIGYSYIYTIHYFRVKFHTPRQVISLIDNRMQLKEGLLTLWDNKNAENPSPLYLVLAQRIIEKLKRFKPELVFPHRFPSPGLSNFIFPLVLAGGVSFSSAFALPQLRNKLKNYLKTVSDSSTKNLLANKLPLNNLLEEEGKGLQKLSLEIARDNDSELAEKIVPSLQKLGDELIDLSKKKPVSIVSNKDAAVQGAVKVANKPSSSKPNLLKALVANELAKLTPKDDPPAQKQKALSAREPALPPISNKTPIPFDPMDTPSDQLKGDISRQLHQMAMDLLNTANQQKAETGGGGKSGTGGADTKDKPAPNSSGAPNQGGGENRLAAMSKGDKYDKLKNTMNQYKSDSETNSGNPNQAGKTPPGAQNPTGGGAANSEKQSGNLISKLLDNIFGGDKNDKQPQSQEGKSRGIKPADADNPNIGKQPDNKQAASLAKKPDAQNKGETTPEDRPDTGSNQNQAQRGFNYNQDQSAKTSTGLEPEKIGDKTTAGDNPQTGYYDDQQAAREDRTSDELKRKLPKDGKDNTLSGDKNDLLNNPNQDYSQGKQLGQTPSADLLKDVKTAAQKLDGLSSELRKLGDIPQDSTTKVQRGNSANQQKAAGKNINPPQNFEGMGDQFIATRMNPRNIEVAPKSQLNALPDEFYEWYIQKWQDESKLPQPPPVAPFKDEVQDKIKVSAQKLELLAGQMMMVSNPQGVDVSEKAKQGLRGFMNKNLAVNAAPGGKTAPGLSQTPDPANEYQKLTAAVSNELQTLLTDTQNNGTKDKDTKRDVDLGKSETFSGGTGSGKQDAVAINGQSPENSVQDTAGIRLQKLPTHQPNHQSITNISLETGLPENQNNFQPDPQKRLSLMRQGQLPDGNSMNMNNLTGGTPSAQDFINQQRRGLQQIKTAMDRPMAPNEMSQITKQLSSLSKDLENVSLQLAQAMPSEAQAVNKSVPAGQDVDKAGPGDNPGQNLKNVPYSSKKDAGGINNKTQPENTKLPNQLDSYKQIKKDGGLAKDDQIPQTDKTPAGLSTGNNSYTQIAAEFAKLRTSMTGTTQNVKIKEITQEMINLSKKMEQNGMENIMLMGSEVKPGKKVGEQFITQSADGLQGAATPSGSNLVYPELGEMKTGNNRDLLKKREAVPLPKEVKNGLANLQKMNDRLQKTKSPEEAKKLSKEILDFSQDLYQLTPKRSDQTVAILKEGVKRQGEKIQDVSQKINKEQDPQKLDGYSLELSLYAAKLKTMGDKADALGWQEGKGVRKYATQVERTADMLKKALKEDILTQGIDDRQRQEMLNRRDAHRLEELSQTIATSDDPEQIQKAAQELVKLSDELSDVKYNMGLGKAKASFAPEAKSAAQNAVQEGGKKLQQLLNRISEHRGELNLKDVGLQLDSIASSLRQASKKNLTEQEGANLKTVSDDLLKIAQKISKNPTAREPNQKQEQEQEQEQGQDRDQNQDRGSDKGQMGKGTKMDIKNTPLNQILPQLAQYANKLGNMELGNMGDRQIADGAASADANLPSGKAIKKLELGLQKAFDSDRLLQIADQLKGLGQKMKDSPAQQKALDPTLRPSVKAARKQSEHQSSGELNEQESMQEMKRQAALQSIDTFLDDLMDQQQKMGKYSLKDFSKNASRDEKIVSATSKGQGGKNRQSLFSKGTSDDGDNGRGVSGVPISEDIDNAYPMEENLASPEVFEKIMKRVKKYREKLVQTPSETLPQSSLSKANTKTAKRETTTTKQPELKSDPRMELGLPSGGEAPRPVKVLAEPQAPGSNVPIVYNKDFNKLNDTVKVPLKSSDLPDQGKDLQNIPLESRNPVTKLEVDQKLSADQKQAAPINHPHIPQEYQDIIKRIYLYDVNEL